MILSKHIMAGVVSVGLVALSGGLAFAAGPANPPPSSGQPSPSGSSAVTVPISTTLSSGALSVGFVGQFTSAKVQLTTVSNSATSLQYAPSSVSYVYAGTGTPSLAVSDTTGQLAGWTLSVQSSPLTEVTPPGGFATGTQAMVLPPGTLQMDAPSTVVAESGQLPEDTPSLDTGKDLDVDAGQAVIVASALPGSGSGSWGFVWTPSSALLRETFSNLTKDVDPTNYPSGTQYAATLVFTVSE